jgi:hypothetical protein
VKIGWVWLTVAFASLIFFQPAYNLSSPSQTQQQTRIRRSLQAFLRWCLATTVWYLMARLSLIAASLSRAGNASRP